MGKTMDIKLIKGDSYNILKTLEENSVDSLVTDPPYGISFMNHRWDYDVPSVEFWQEVLRVLKPGSHGLVFCGTRTQHRMVVNIEDAGFEIRDVITWLYGQGFPHGLDISKQIDKTLGYEREKVRIPITPHSTAGKGSSNEIDERPWLTKARELGYNETVSDVPASEEAKKWDGWNTVLKPACEFITLIRKPLSEETVALNVLKWGTGGINVDGTRIELNGEIVPINKLENWSGFGQIDRPDYIPTQNTEGRWPANLILDEEAGEMLGEQKRFFYCPKPSKKERGDFNLHPTVKPLDLTKYLVKMVTPFKGICLDPFLGSGTTAIACQELGMDCVGIEREEEYIEISRKRLGI